MTVVVGVAVHIAMETVESLDILCADLIISFICS